MTPPRGSAAGVLSSALLQLLLLPLCGGSGGGRQLLRRRMGPEWSPRSPGTTTQLANVIGSSTFGGETVEFINGRSKAHVYRALSERATGGIGIVKLWCMPDEYNLLDAHKGRKYCSLDNARTTIRRMMALQRVTEECGLEDLPPRMWEEQVIAEIPDKGYWVERHGLFQDIAPGVSLWGFTESAHAQLVNEVMAKVNSTQVVRAAIYDLLFSMCDRHLGNIFIDLDGNIKLIDNDQAFGITDEKHEMCSLSSVFLPTTQCHAIAALGKDYAKRRLPQDKPQPPNPGVTLDYRCHAPGGKIGREYPPQVQHCLHKFARMSAETIKEEYGFTTLVAAYHLKVRAWTMYHLGFEFALYHGAPQNPSCESFARDAPCCRVGLAPGVPRNATGAGSLACAAPAGWTPSTGGVPPLCKPPVQLGEDLSYAGEGEGSCRVCKMYGNGWKLGGGGRAAYAERVPDHSWEVWEERLPGGTRRDLPTDSREV
mmetsp:Transcript_4979/g.12507  ORF Transcript_4979/g.12507 Transcript_4979/m.12507 type:complete len:483 (-) Transcript_4979:195-1643(-)